jgi:hypothetical protein
MSEVTLKAPEGVAGASVSGVEYKVDGAGFIDASVTHMAALIEHGFKQATRTQDDVDLAKAKAEAEQKAQEEAAAEAEAQRKAEEEAAAEAAKNAQEDADASKGDESAASGETDANAPAANARPKKTGTTK